MTKQFFIDPQEMRKPGYIEFDKIPVNQYNRSIEEEKKNYAKDDFLRIYRDMRFIREFETMLYAIKTTNAYNGIEYNNPGPAHLSMGHEASSVGQAYLLSTDDFIFGSHRSHGEILAKGLSAINQLSEAELVSVMENFLGGDAYRAVTKFHAGKNKSAKEIAVDFLIYGALAEIFARRPASTRAWAARCTPSSCPSASTPTTPSSAARPTSRSARRCSRRSTARTASSSATSVTARWPAVRSGKA